MEKAVSMICIHNVARSQMAEALLNLMCGDKFEAYSAGLSPGTLNPLAVEVLREIDTDISRRETESVFDVFKSGHMFTYTVTV